MVDMTTMSASAPESAHADRVALLDPALPTPAPLTDSDGDLLTATVGAATAVGRFRLRVLAPTDLGASWGALRRHSLTLRTTGADPGPAVDDLLSRWEAHLAALAEPDDPESSATVTLPSRDVAPVGALVRHGFAPMVAVSVRQAGAPDLPTSGPEPVLRPLTEADLDVAVELHLAEMAYDAAFHTLTVRPETAAGVRAELAELAAGDGAGAWLAEHDGQPVGLVTLELPPASAWMAGLTSLSPIGYLGLMVVRPEFRGRGIGRALARRAHTAAAEAGMAAVLLHHVLPNPLSTPFWLAQGYRPLWTSWTRRPAVRSGP
jgi:GNAT superfamily N-acetyltransferase